MQQEEGLLAQQGDSDQVADRHQSHGDIRQTPDQIEAGQGAKEHHAPHQQAIDQEHRWAGGDETDVCLALIVVADDATEGEQQDGHRHEDTTCAAHLGAQRLLRQLHAVQTAIQRHATEKNNECGTGTDN